MDNFKNKKIYIYNSYNSKIEEFKPINENQLNIYVCGPTVYGDAHIGHGRSAITFDIIIRYFKYCGYKIKYVRNYTDVGHLVNDSDDGEDKIQKQSKKEQIEPMEIVQKYINSYRTDMDLLNITKPNIEPQATSYINEQIELVKDIIDKGFGYIVNGSVYFNVRKYNEFYKNYGQLSGRKIDDLLSETRDLNNQNEKQDNLDFALWKKADDNHIMKWSSPWSLGYPGWHSECVVLSTKYLGDVFDIHGGGMDLKFPHHECEIAQSKVYKNTNLANYWVHNNLVTINGKKMSKSLNNYIILHDLFYDNNNIFGKTFLPMDLRFLMLQTHYRSTLSLTLEGLEAAHKGYIKLINGLKDFEDIINEINEKNIKNLNENDCKNFEDNINNKINSIFDAFCNDFNTAIVISILFDLVKIINDIKINKLDITTLNTDFLKEFYNIFKDIIIEILGLTKPNVDTEMINCILELYKEANKNKNFEQKTFIRTKLEKCNIRISDFGDKIFWNYC